MLLQTNLIGLDSQKAIQLAKSLNELLANYQVFYMNVRGYHWNIKGEKFFELHAKFEELYADLQIKIDEIAERILTLGETPRHSFSSYLEKAEIKTHEEVREGRIAVEGILEAFRILLGQQRGLLEQSAEANDEGTNALMSDYIREQEKLVWMYAAYLG
ncbi:MAG: Dps family protein [Bacteroidota bacterium]